MQKFFLFILSFIFCSCNLEPQYVRPCLDLPETWKEKAFLSQADANIRWWEGFEDPILDALILNALNNNKDLQVAIWRVCEFFARYEIVRASLFPEVDFSASAIKERFPVDGSTTIPSNFQKITPFYNFNFSLAYELDFWGGIRSAAHAAYADALANVEARRVVVLTLVSNVAASYIYLRQLDEERLISYKTLKSRKESLEIAKLRFEGGLTSEIEVKQAASLYDETLAIIADLERAIPQQENLLSLLLGENPSYILRGLKVGALFIPPAVPAGLPSELLERRPDILQAEYRLVASNAQIGVARAAFFPKISLTGLYGGQSFQLKSLFTGAARYWQFGVSIFQPLFTGGKLSGQLKEAIAQNQEAYFQYEQVVLNAFREVNDALVGHSQAKIRAAIEKDRVKELEKYLHLSWLRYYNGQTEYLTVLDAERQLFRAEIDLCRAQGATASTLVDLFRALGGGWVIDADCNLVNCD